MKRVLLLCGVLLFIIGSMFFLGAYFIFNQYSVSGSHNFQGYYHETWKFPETPLELNEGDKVIATMSKFGSFDGNFYIISTSGKQVLLSNSLSNSTIYYYIQTNDFYYLYIDINSWGSSELHSVILNIVVVSRSPNLLFLLIGVIVLLAGAATIPVAFLYKTKNEKLVKD